VFYIKLYPAAVAIFVSESKQNRYFQETYKEYLYKVLFHWFENLRKN